jgi:hypothetical protein
MTARAIDEYGVRKLLLKACKKAGGAETFAAKHGLAADHVKDVIKGAAAPGHSIPKALGLMAVTRYARQPKGRAA